MRILLIAFGSRGDVQPVLALGRGLTAAGYDITIGAGANFQAWIEGAGFDYAPFAADVQAMMRGPSGRAWIEESSRSSLKEAQNMRAMIDEHGAQITADLVRMCADADVLVSGLPTFGLVESMAQQQDKPHISLMLAPFKPTRAAEATLVPPIPGWSSRLNRITGRVGIYFMWRIFKEVTNRYRAQAGLPRWRYWDYLRHWTGVPVLYGFSPHVVPPSDDWAGFNAVTGYWFWDEGADWQPPAALADFLTAGPKPVYIGFGSMSNSQPEETARLMVAALARTGQRGVISSGWAGLHASDLPDHVCLIEGAPHDWLFPRMAAVVHHGGSGTTGAAIRAGVPNTVVAHMADQPFWGRRVYELGVGAPVIRRHDLTVDALAQAIEQMVTDTAMQQRAARLGERVRGEDGVANAVRAFDTLLRPACATG